MTAPGILLVISSLGITALFALGPGKNNSIIIMGLISSGLVEGLLFVVEILKVLATCTY